jgi:hypothetical protein
MLRAMACDVIVKKEWSKVRVHEGACACACAPVGMRARRKMLVLDVGVA